MEPCTGLGSDSVPAPQTTGRTRTCVFTVIQRGYGVVQDLVLHVVRIPREQVG
jgi:hypothetical protein